MWDFCVVKARTCFARIIFGSWRFWDTARISVADVVEVALCVYAGGA